MKAVHIKSGKTYTVIDDNAEVKIEGKWVRAVIYKANYDASLPTFIRPHDNFIHKFVILDEPQITLR